MKTYKFQKLGETSTKFVDGDRSSKYPSRSEFVDFGIAFLNAESIKTGRINVETVNHIAKEKYDSILKGRIKRNDVLMTTRGNGIGDVALVTQSDPALINAQMLILRPDQAELDSTFLYYFLKSAASKEMISIFSSGSAQPQIPIRDLKHLPIVLPSLPIQRKIAAVLSAYDDLIENNRRRIALLEKAAEELYREWFVRLRFPGHEQTKVVKGVPEGWEVTKLGNVVNTIMGQSPSSEFYNEDGIGLPFNQGVGTFGSRYPKRVSFCSVNRRIANSGDILISVRAPVGRLNIADCKMIIGRGLAALRHKDEKNSYLFYLLKNIFKEEDKIGNGAIFNAVTKDELLGISFIKPEEPLLSLFDATIHPIDQTIQTIDTGISLLSTSRDRLLSRLMSGKIDVEDLDIRFPASMREEAE